MEKLNTIYGKTYNFVYLRAKCILKKEEEVQQLMKEVYLKAATEEVEDSKLYTWLAKQVYILGCSKFRKKKAREAERIELSEEQYRVQERVDREQTKEIIKESLENLPDLYLATLYACYYDHLSLKEISNVMGYNVGVVRNRLNYVHKYLTRALEDYKEEYGEHVQFSVEIVCEALRDWSAGHQLSEATMKNVYAMLCRELGTVSEEGAIAYGVAGANCRAVEKEADDVESVSEELERYTVRKCSDKKQIALFAGIGVLVVLLIFGGVLLGKSKKPEKKDDKPFVEIKKEEMIQDEIPPEESDEDVMDESEYILAKSGTEKLIREDLASLTKEQLRLARNEIYARHGMIFGVEDLDQYFATKSWYKATVSFTDFYNTVELSLIEEENVMLIQQVEKER